MTHSFTIEVNEGERKSHIERVGLVGVGASLARLECDHQINEASRPPPLVFSDQIISEQGTQQTLKCLIYTRAAEWSSSSFEHLLDVTFFV